MVSTDSIVAQATADLQRAEREALAASEKLARANAEVAELRGFLSTLQRYASGDSSPSGGATAAEHVQNTTRNVLREGTIGRRLVDACIDAIEAEGKPLPIGVLLDWVLSEGLTVGGTDQKSNLAGYLSRDPRMKSLGRTIGWTVIKDEEAAPEPASEDAASSTTEGGTDERSALVHSEFDDLLGSSNSQVP